MKIFWALSRSTRFWVKMMNIQMTKAVFHEILMEFLLFIIFWAKSRPNAYLDIFTHFESLEPKDSSNII